MLLVAYVVNVLSQLLLGSLELWGTSEGHPTSQLCGPSPRRIPKLRRRTLWVNTGAVLGTGTGMLACCGTGMLMLR